MTGTELYPQFTAAFTEFRELEQASVEYQLQLSCDSLSPTALGTWLRHAVFLRSAHYLALRWNIQPGMAAAGVNPGLASSGTVTSISAGTGDLSQTISPNEMATGGNPVKADFARTGYGLEYLSLLRQVLSPSFLVRSGKC